MTPAEAVAALPVLRITREDLEALPEYSLTLPTGTSPGRRWRRNVAASLAQPRAGDDAVWCVGEYGVKQDGQVQITWYRPEEST